MKKFYLNCLGLTCPEPLTLIRAKLRLLDKDDILEVLSDDLVSKRDIPSFCKFMGHKLEQLDKDKTFLYIITKGEKPF